MAAQDATSLQAALGPLLGVVVGALLSALTSWWLEHTRFTRDRREKLATLKRDAIGSALKWIQPMRNAQALASSLVTAAIHGQFDHDAFLRQYPYLLGELKGHDLSGEQRAILPDSAYSQGHRIVRHLDELQFLGIEHGARATTLGQTLSGFDEIGRKLAEIESDISRLETDLQAAFRSTFD